jgi:hypothetical protein
VAIEMAHRMGLPAMQVMQNLYIVHGRPTWKAEFVISRLHGKYADIDFEKDGQEGGRCRVVATRHDGRRVEGTWVSMKMAQAEGWTSRKDRNNKETSKWATMPEQMMMYRAATFFARVHAPELLNGVADQYEVSDVGYERESAAVQAINDSLRFTKQEQEPQAPEPVQSEILDDEILDDEIL